MPVKEFADLVSASSDLHDVGHQAGRNMARFYLVDVQPALFGWSVVREWSRIGRGGRVAVDLFDTPKAAVAACRRKVADNKRRGYVALSCCSTVVL